MKALNFELENDRETSTPVNQRRKTLVDEIIRRARSIPATNTFRLSQSMPTGNTLQMEHYQLALNLRFDNFRFFILDDFSSFQHVDKFKMTSHMLRTFSACNSNLSEMMRTQGEYHLRTFSETSFFRLDLFLLGFFLCFNASRFVYNLDSQTFPSWKN